MFIEAEIERFHKLPEGALFLTVARKMLNFTRYTFQKQLDKIGMLRNN
jgi:hypothetical protein